MKDIPVCLCPCGEIAIYIDMKTHRCFCAECKKDEYKEDVKSNDGQRRSKCEMQRS